MSCQPELVTGFVDGALSPDETLRIQNHLESCDVCRAQAEDERRLRQQLKNLPPVTPRPGLEFAVRRSVKRHRSPRARWLVPLAAALVGIALWLPANPTVVAFDVARDHAKCFAHQPMLPAKVFSDDATRVTRWFSEHGASLPSIPSRVGRLQLVGGRFCPLLSGRTPHLYYTSDRGVASVFLLPGRVRIAEQFRSDRVDLLRVGDDVVAIVGDEDAREGFSRAFRVSIASLY